MMMMSDDELRMMSDDDRDNEKTMMKEGIMAWLYVVDMSVRTIIIIIIIISISIIIIIIITHTCPEGEVTGRSRSWINALPVMPVTAGGSYHAMVTLSDDM